MKNIGLKGNNFGGLPAGCLWNGGVHLRIPKWLHCHCVYYSWTCWVSLTRHNNETELFIDMLYF